MRKVLYSSLLATVVMLTPAVALAQSGAGQVQAFGGLTLRGITPASTFGGSLAVPVGDHVQILAEGGRMSDVMSGPLATLVSFSPVDVKVTAYYGEGGVRFLGSPNRVVRPYAEATAGFARLHTRVAGLGEVDPLVNAALGFLGSTQPVLGGGAGVMIQGGPVLVDLGYRYHHFGSGNSLQNALTGGGFDSHQLRMGVGIRF